MPVFKRKCWPGARRQPNPPRGKHAQHVPVCEQGDVAAGGACPGDHLVHSRTHLLRRLATRASIPEDQPVRRPLRDLPGREPLVLAVVPFQEIRIDGGRLAEPCKFTGLSCPLQRTDQNERKCLLGKRGPHPFGLPAPVLGQGDIRRAGVLTAQAPLGLPVPDRIYAHVRPSWLRRCLPPSSLTLQTLATAPTSNPRLPAYRRRSGRCTPCAR